jgi:hypothetical protein
VASGVLTDSADFALTASAAVARARGVWIRDGLGRVAAAHLMAGTGTPDIATLQLTSPLAKLPEPLALVARDPFPGSPAYVAGYAASADDQPAWPLMRPGFLGASVATPGIYALGIEVPAGFGGGAVFDLTGALAGLVVRDPAGGHRILLASRLRAAFAAMPSVQVQPPQRRMAPDEIYELAMPRVVQVLVAS